MRELVEYLAREWETVSSAPLVFVIGCVIVGSLVWVAARARYSGIAEGAQATADTARERLAAAKEDIERLKGEKSELISRLEQHGADISSIQAQLDAMPTYYYGDEPPGDANDGDVWIDTSKK